MGQFFEYIKIAYKSIASNKGRTFLTMLGIIIGISSVIMISGVGSGVKNVVSGSLGDLFRGQTYIHALDEEVITKEDVEYISANVPELVLCTPELYPMAMEVESVKGTFTLSMVLVNETYEYYETYGKGMLHGRYFTKEEVERGERVCVLRETDAISFFGSADVVGQEISTEMEGVNVSFKIVGVRNSTDSQLVGMMGLLDGAHSLNAEVPYTCYESITGDDWYSTDFSSLLLSINSTDDAAEILERVVGILEARHFCKGEDRFYVDSFDTEMEGVNKVIGYVTLFISFVSAISLVVGGVGVMNIMLVSVTERTQEIGIRKALGARTGSIMVQFLAEAAMITFVGGIIGVIAGYIGAEVLCLIVGAIVKLKIGISVSVPIVALSCVFSTAVGIGFGIVPARKAAHLSPIEALRQE